jgi:hypothetical protein
MKFHAGDAGLLKFELKKGDIQNQNAKKKASREG